jgi:hypothetical protein
MIGASYDGFQLPQRVAVGCWSMALAGAFCVTISNFRSPAQHCSHTGTLRIFGGLHRLST